MTHHYLAVDLGAESGRLMLGTLADGRLALEELHRFPNVPLREGGSMMWDMPSLFAGVKEGLRKAAGRNLPIASISCDSWGLDYVLLDEREEIIAPTFHYRDARTARGVDAVRGKVPWETVFAETGIQFMPINTIYQLAAESPARLARARRMLMIGDAFNWWLGGKACTEISLASTSQLYNPSTRAWSKTLLEALQLPAQIFPELQPSGAKLGTLRSDLASETGLSPEIAVLATCSHDTGAAVAAVPAAGGKPDWAYLSSGTWSLMGVELAEPNLTDRCRELNFTNEIGHENTVRLLKNIVGLWIVQECRRTWAAEGNDYTYAQLTEMAAAVPPFASLINPADPRFMPPDGMPARIAAYCRETGQPVPASPGAVVRCALESLALLYRRTLRQIEELTRTPVTRLHIVGGGSRNALLNQFAANALQIPVHTGPVEATALGNILVQSLALGHLPSLNAARDVVRQSFDVQIVQPRDREIWESAAARFEKLG